MRRPGPTNPLIALLLVACASPALAQNAQYPPWPPPPEANAVDENLGPPAGPPEPPPQGQPPPYDYQTQGQPNAAQIGAPRSAQLVTPAQEGSKSLTTAAEAPLHEMNLVGQKIPPILLAALADPYASLNPVSCRTLSDEIDRLTVALGPDFDNPPPKQKKKIAGSGGLGLQFANNAAGNLLPFHGYVGALTGSSKHDALIIRALDAGSARRAYLKGLGEARRCPEPAAPRHLANAAPPIYDGPRRPKYPIQ